jgi:anti-sigma factor RsiW
MENLSTLTCDVTSDLMILYTSGKASAETRRSIETHLQTCPACARRKVAGRTNPAAQPVNESIVA